MHDDFFYFLRKHNLFNIKPIVTFLQMITYLSVIYVICSLAFFDLYRVTSNSMSPTLQGDYNFSEDDRIFVFKGFLNFQPPTYNDIIVFKSKENHQRILVKRIVGLPGDEIYIKPNKNIYINGKPQLLFFCRPYKWAKHIHRQYMPRNGWASKSIRIPTNHYFVLGDDTNNSEDSRMLGWIARKNIVGKVHFIWFPLSRIRSFLR